MLDWIFEGIVTWVSSIVSQMMDAVSGLFLDALGTNMTAMEEYFPFVSKAYDIMQYTAWAILFLITVWQLFRVFGGPITEVENPWTLLEGKEVLRSGSALGRRSLSLLRPASKYCRSSVDFIYVSFTMFFHFPVRYRIKEISQLTNHPIGTAYQTIAIP